MDTFGFRKLSDEETKEFRQWARENYVVLTPIKGIWHPVVQSECTKMNVEYTEKRDQERKQEEKHVRG